MQNKIAHIFPAFVLKYTGKELNVINKYPNDFNHKVNLANELLNLDLSGFDIENNNFITQELENQILSYIFSCTFSDILYNLKKSPNIISGFSMGLYSALYHSKSISFNTGLQLIKEVYIDIKQIFDNERHLMASVIGFNKSDLKSLISNSKSVEIAIENGSFSFVISGKEVEIKPLMQKLQLEGAVHVSLFNVSFPYHSKILSNHKLVFEKIVAKYKIDAPKTPIMSMISQIELSTKKQVSNEIVKNITQPLSFYKTIKELNSLGTKQFIEVGADSSLLKSSKFIDGDFDFQAIAKGKIL